MRDSTRINTQNEMTEDGILHVENTQNENVGFYTYTTPKTKYGILHLENT